MGSIRFVAAILTVLVGLTSCSRDPNVVKKRYLESGNKYFEKGRYKEASIQYRNALKRDPKFGAAHYKLALVAMKVSDVGGAVGSLRRAVELIPPDQPDHWDAVIKLTEIYLGVAKGEKQYMDEVEKFTKELLKRDPNSYDAHRLIGDLNYSRATVAYKEKRMEEGLTFLSAAIEEYRKSEAIKPGQQGVSMQLARSLAAKGDFAGAEKLYRSVSEKDKTYQYAYTELYRLYVFQNKPGDAEQVLRAAFQNNPKQFGFLTLLAMHFSGLQRREEMVTVLNEIKSHARDFDQAYLTVGDFYLRMGDGDSAIREYKEGIAKDTKKKSTYQKRVIEVLMRQGKRSEAAEINSQILKETPDDNDARGLAATFLLDKGDIAKALAELQAVVTRAPDNPVSRYNLGRAHGARGEWEQARQQFTKAIEIRPDYVLARLSLAQLQVNRGEFEGALKTAEAVLKIDPGSVNARLIESAALMGQRKFGDSHVMLDAMLKSNPGSPDVLFQLGVVNLAENRYKEAEDAFRRAYQLNPANSRGLMGIVETSMAQNKTDEALKLLQTESDKAPNRLDLLLAMGNTAVRAGKYDFAIQTYNKVLGQMDKDAKQGEIYLRLGETYRRKGDINGAIQALQKARETMPENVVVLSTLGLVLDGAQRRPEAKQVYEATLKLDPNNAVVLNNLAFLMAESGGDLDEALTKAQRAKQLLPTLPEISDTLGWIYLKKNLADNAIDIFKDLVAKQPSHSTYHFHLGMAYQQKGDKTKALEQLRESLKYNPVKEEKDKIQQLITRLG
ncbi:MAG: tetratricopeptide repeat protein [Candidatus Solibacter sp.]